MSDERPPVERTTSYTTDVETIDEALAFVLTQLDVVDEIVAIRIDPFYRVEVDTAQAGPQKRYSVSVTGSVDLAPYDPRPDLRAL